MIKKLFFLATIVLAFASCQKEQAYVFSYFDTIHQGAGLCLAYSLDGYQWTALNDNQPVLAPTVGEDKLMRDPSICQAPDGTFHMVWTTSWHDNIIGYASSPDLIHWSEQKAIPVMKDYPSVRNSWAPELFYCKKERCYYILWASTVPDSEEIDRSGSSEESGGGHRIYCTTTQDFVSFTPTRLYFNSPFNAIDAAVVQDPATGEYIMTVKDESEHPAQKNIRVTHTLSMADGFPTAVSEPIHNEEWSEGPSPLFLNKQDLIVFFDRYRSHTYGASLSHDHGQTWEDVSAQISMPKGMSHGTAIKVDKCVVDRLIEQYK